MATLLPEVQLQVLVWSLQPVADLGRGGGGDANAPPFGG